MTIEDEVKVDVKWQKILKFLEEFQDAYAKLPQKAKRDVDLTVYRGRNCK